MQEENIVALLKETLKFYGEPANYENDQIKNDGGHMARFAVEQVKKLEESADKLEQAFDELQGKVDEKTPEDVQNIIDDFLNGRL
jgi:hypothetical protein